MRMRDRRSRTSGHKRLIVSLTSPQEFEALKKWGIGVACRSLIISSLSMDELNLKLGRTQSDVTGVTSRAQWQVTHLGLVVSKRNGNAVVRNRIKRQFRAMFSQLFYVKGSDSDEVSLIKDNYAYVMISRNMQATLAPAERLRDIKYCLMKLNDMAERKELENNSCIN